MAAVEAFDAVDLIRAKRDRRELTTAEIDWLVEAYTRGYVADEQMSAMTMAIFLNGMSRREIRDLTMAMIASGERMDFSGLGKPTSDKHSTGGVGDKITLPLMPLVATFGVAVPQLSGRGLGHTGGTLDKLESIPGWRAEISNDEMFAQLRDVGGVICAAGAGLAPADKKLYALRDITGTVEAIPLIASSIMSKKIAEGTSALVLDVKFGSGAFLQDIERSRELARTMVELGEDAGVATSALLTNMNVPLGRTIGNANEVRESVEVLAGGGPADVRELTIALAREMLARAGRDGLPADAWMAYGLQDVITLRQMQQDSSAHDHQKRIEQQKLDAMLGLCEIISCRRQALLHYFGDHLDAPCGNCDNCLTPPETWDATVAAQKALSCVYRTEQRFGVTYLVDVLLGKSNERIPRFGHDKISTFGIGKDLSASEWKTLFRQLIASGFLSVDMEGHGGVHLTAHAKPVLRGEKSLTLRKPSKAKAARRGSKGGSGAQGHGALWEALRQHRKALADAQGVPAYVIFNDATLAELSEQRPQSLAALGGITGIGARKLEDYGEGILAVITAHKDAPSSAPVGDSALESAALLRQGLAPEEIAQARGLAPNTVYRHLADVIESGALALDQVIQLDENTLNQIRAAFEQHAGLGMKAVFDALDGRFDYNVLACVRAWLAARPKSS